MTTEVKAMVDALPIVSHSVIDWKEAELVNKSDVLALVEKLTGWVKVEDGLPKSKEILTDVLVKIKGKRWQCNLGIVTATFDRRTGKFNTGEKWVEVTEWRYIY